MTSRLRDHGRLLEVTRERVSSRESLCGSRSVGRLVCRPEVSTGRVGGVVRGGGCNVSRRDANGAGMLGRAGMFRDERAITV